jgi:hypothetical protein
MSYVSKIQSRLWSSSPMETIGSVNGSIVRILCHDFDDDARVIWENPARRRSMSGLSAGLLRSQTWIRLFLFETQWFSFVS